MKDWKSFDDAFDRDFRRMERRASVMMAFGIVWFLFIMGCLGAGLFLLGRWTGVW